MDKNKIKSTINVAAVILVPLINERHKLKNQKEVQQLTNLTVKAYDVTKDKSFVAAKKAKQASTTVKSGVVTASSFIAGKYKEEKKNRNYKKQMQPFIKEAKSEKKLKKQEQKDIKKMQDALNKSIEERAESEQKLRNENEKKRIKEMKQYKNYKVKSPKQKKSVFSFMKPQTTINADIIYHNAQIHNDEDFSNAQLFEQHRKQMAEKIAKR